MLRKPSTVNEWLLNLGLPQYIQTFHENGWDSMECVGDITATDLTKMEMTEEGHRERVLKSITDIQQQFSEDQYMN